MASDIKPFTATIASGGSLSGAVSLGGYVPFLLVMPAGWDTAGLTFQVTYDGSSWVNLYDTGGEYSISSSVVGASRAIAILGAELFLGAIGIKIRSGTAGTPVTQTAERSIIVQAREL